MHHAALPPLQLPQLPVLVLVPLPVAQPLLAIALPVAVRELVVLAGSTSTGCTSQYQLALVLVPAQY
jgi:hypothetical protein